MGINPVLMGLLQGGGLHLAWQGVHHLHCNGPEAKMVVAPVLMSLLLFGGLYSKA